MTDYVKLTTMPPLHPLVQSLYEGPLIPVPGDSTSVVTMPTDEQMQRLFAVHAVTQFLGQRSIAEILIAARFVETGDVLVDDGD